MFKENIIDKVEVKKIVIITTGQPSTNPRAVKEATALADVGYKVIFVYNFWAAWALPYDEKIVKENPDITWQMAGSNPFSNKAGYYFSRLRHKCFRLLSNLYPSNISIASQGASRGSSSLAKIASRVKADLYIAHNLGALPAAALAAKKHHAKYAFDAEDYHRGQDVPGSIEQKRTILLEDKYLPSASYITAASPLIAEYYSKLYNRKVTVIHNVFSKRYLVETIKKSSRPVRLFWFSQTIGKGRGLEDIILALKEMPAGTFSLTLLGKHHEMIKNYLTGLGKGKETVSIQFIAPVSSDEIFTIAAQHDIGLALEQAGEFNRDLCLTNKIFTYLLAGNAIIFSDTKAQRQFYEEHTGIGAIYDNGNISGLIEILKRYQKDNTLLMSHKQHARTIANDSFNWENEMNTFKTLISRTLETNNQ